MRKILNLSLEDDSIVDPTLGVSVDAGAAVDSAETALIDVNEGAAEITSVDTQLATVEAAADALEEIAESMPATIEAGGLTPEAANTVGLAVEGYYKMLGMSTKSLPAMEHYGNASSRVQSTRLAMEGIKETAKAAWEAIKKYIKKIADWILAQYNKIFGNAERLQARAKALQKRVEADLPGTPKEAKIENETVAKGLHVNGDVTNVSTNIAKLEAMSKATFGPSFDQTESGIDASVKSLEDIANSGDISKYEVPVMTPSGVTAKDPKALGYKEVSATGVKFGIGDELPGGKAVVSYFIDTALTGKDAVMATREVSAKIDLVNKAKNAPTVKAKFDTLKIADCEKVLEAVVSISGELKSFRGKQGKLKTVLDKANKAANDLSKKAEAETEADKAAAFNLSGKALTALVRQATELQYSTAVYVLNTSKAALDAVELSVKQYEAAKA